MTVQPLTSADFDNDETALFAWRNLELRQRVKMLDGVNATLYAEIERLKAENATVRREKRRIQQQLDCYRVDVRKDEGEVYRATRLEL